MLKGLENFHVIGSYTVSEKAIASNAGEITKSLYKHAGSSFIPTRLRVNYRDDVPGIEKTIVTVKLSNKENEFAKDVLVGAIGSPMKMPNPLNDIIFPAEESEKHVIDPNTTLDFDVLSPVNLSSGDIVFTLFGNRVKRKPKK